MPSSLSSLSLCLLITSVAAGGCDDDTCGVQGAPQTGIVAASADAMLTYGDLTSGANNDCPAMPGVTSLTIFGSQTSGTGTITFCIPRPDQLGQAGRTLGLDQVGGDIRIVDLSGSASNCTYAIDRATPPVGTGSAEGLCDNGKNSAGFALVLEGTVGLKRTCGTTTDVVSFTMAGRVAVVPQMTP